MQIQYANVPALLGEPTKFLSGETVPLPPDGSGYDLGVRLSSEPASYLSVQPDGSYQVRAAAGGSYERFKLDPDLNVLLVRPRVAVYKIAYKEI